MHNILEIFFTYSLSIGRESGWLHVWDVPFLSQRLYSASSCKIATSSDNLPLKENHGFKYKN